MHPRPGNTVSLSTPQSAAGAVRVRLRQQHWQHSFALVSCEQRVGFYVVPESSRGSSPSVSMYVHLALPPAPCSFSSFFGFSRVQTTCWGSLARTRWIGVEWSGRLATRLITRLFARPLQRQQGERQLLRPERHLLQAQRRALAAQRRLRSQHCGVALIAAWVRLHSVAAPACEACDWSLAATAPTLTATTSTQTHYPTDDGQRLTEHPDADGDGRGRRGGGRGRSFCILGSGNKEGNNKSEDNKIGGVIVGRERPEKVCCRLHSHWHICRGTFVVFLY